MRPAQPRSSASLRTHLLAVLFPTLQLDSFHMDNFASLVPRNDM